MSSYLGFYYVHIGAVCVSGAFFLLRGLWMLQGSSMLDARFVRISPHVIDTVLLLAAIGLAVVTRQYPITHDWLTVKLCALIAYILLGMFALRRARTRAVRIACFVAALGMFGFMVSVALTRHPFGVFSIL